MRKVYICHTGFAVFIAAQCVTAVVMKMYPESIHAMRFISMIPTPLAWDLAIIVLYVLVRRLGYTYGMSIILSGFLSNIVTYLLIGHFVDYIPTGISYLNVEDLSILIGIGIVWREYLSHIQ